MKSRIAKRFGCASVGVCALFAGLFVAPSVSTASGPNWTSLQQESVAAIARYDNAGEVTATNPLPEGTSSMVVKGATVSIQEETFDATDGTGTSIVTMTLLGGTQLLVHLVPMSGTQATAIELAPGTYATEAITHSRMGAVPAGTKPGGLAPDSVTSVWIGNCEAWVYSPQTEPSIYGELIYGGAGYYIDACPTTSASVLVGLYYWNGYQGVGLNDTNGASGNPSASPGVAATAYYPCAAGGPVYFQAAALYNASGEGSGGASSDWAYLTCAA